MCIISAIDSTECFAMSHNDSQICCIIHCFNCYYHYILKLVNGSTTSHSVSMAQSSILISIF